MGELRILVAEARPVLRRRLEALVAATAGARGIGGVATLMEAYTLVESEVPDVALVGAMFRAQPEYAMFSELANLLGVQLVPASEDIEAVALALGQVRAVPASQCPASRSKAPSRRAAVEGGVIVIGASTGGVEALHRLLADFPADCPPTLVVQHIRGSFSGAFAERLDRACRPEVVEAAPGMPLLQGRIFIAPGADRHLQLGHGTPPACKLLDAPPVSGHRPSVDMLFRSAAALGERAVAVLLTGMGQDGARGMLAVRNSGGHTIAQDEATSTVYGMPRVAAELGAATEILPLGRIAAAALTAARRRAGRGEACA